LVWCGPETMIVVTRRLLAPPLGNQQQ
jgi:hypothetical protein